MNKIFIIFLVSCFFFLKGIAQEPVPIFAPDTDSKEINDLVGVWQMCIFVPNPENPEKPLLRRSSAFKFLNKDGSFYNMILSPQVSNFTVFGTYEINSEDSYTEIIDRSYTNPMDNNRKNQLNYEFANDGRFLFIKYISINSNTGEAGEARELWVKIEPGNPFPRNNPSQNSKK